MAPSALGRSPVPIDAASSATLPPSGAFRATFAPRSRAVHEVRGRRGSVSKVQMVQRLVPWARRGSRSRGRCTICMPDLQGPVQQGRHVGETDDRLRSRLWRTVAQGGRSRSRWAPYPPRAPDGAHLSSRQAVTRSRARAVSLPARWAQGGRAVTLGRDDRHKVPSAQDVETATDPPAAPRGAGRCHDRRRSPGTSGGTRTRSPAQCQRDSALSPLGSMTRPPGIPRWLLGTTIFAEVSALAVREHEAPSTSAGFPGHRRPGAVLDAVKEAIDAGCNQYPPGPWRPRTARRGALHQKRFHGLDVDARSGPRHRSDRGDPRDDPRAGCSPATRSGHLQAYDSYAASIALAGGVRRTVPALPGLVLRRDPARQLQ